MGKRGSTSVPRRRSASAPGAFEAQQSWNDQLGDAYSQFATQTSGMAPQDYDAARADQQRREDEEEKSRPGSLEAFGRGGLQGLTFGFGDEIGGVLKGAFSNQAYHQARDEIRANNRRAREAEPLAYGIGDILGGAATTFATGGAGMVAEAPLAAAGLGTAARAGITGAAEGALQGVGYSDEDGVGGILRDAGIGAALGGGIGAGAGKLTEKAIAGAEGKATRQFAQDITEGATPTFRKRFVGETDQLAQGEGGTFAEMARDTISNDKKFMKAADKPPEAAAVAKERLEELSAEVKPIYQKFDQEVGEVPLGSVTDSLDEAIGKAAQDPNGAPTRAVLEEVKDDFVKAHQARHPGTYEGAITVPSQEVRRWVTGLLEHKTRTMGALDETARYELASAAHEAGDDFLRSWLDRVGTEAPGMADDVAKLRQLNRKIAVYAHADQLMRHKANRALWKPQSLAEQLDARAGQAAPVIGAAVGGAGGAIQAIAMQQGIKTALHGVKKADRAATAALAKLVRGARQGDVSKQAILAAVRAGVPMATVGRALSFYRQAVPPGLEEPGVQ